MVLSMDLLADFSQHTSEAKHYFYSHFETGKYDIQISTEVRSNFMYPFKEKKAKMS